MDRSATLHQKDVKRSSGMFHSKTFQIRKTRVFRLYSLLYPMLSYILIFYVSLKTLLASAGWGREWGLGASFVLLSAKYHVKGEILNSLFPRFWP